MSNGYAQIPVIITSSNFTLDIISRDIPVIDFNSSILPTLSDFGEPITANTWEEYLESGNEVMSVEDFTALTTSLDELVTDYTLIASKYAYDLGQLKQVYERMAQTYDSELKRKSDTHSWETSDRDDARAKMAVASSAMEVAELLTALITPLWSDCIDAQKRTQALLEGGTYRFWNNDNARRSLKFAFDLAAQQAQSQAEKEALIADFEVTLQTQLDEHTAQLEATIAVYTAKIAEQEAHYESIIAEMEEQIERFNQLLTESENLILQLIGESEADRAAFLSELASIQAGTATTNSDLQTILDAKAFDANVEADILVATQGVLQDRIDEEAAAAKQATTLKIVAGTSVAALLGAVGYVASSSRPGKAPLKLVNKQ